MRVIKVTEECAIYILYNQPPNQPWLITPSYCRSFTTNEEITEYLNGSEETNNVKSYVINLQSNNRVNIRIDETKILTYSFKSPELRKAFLLGFEDKFYGKSWVIYDEDDKEFSKIYRTLVENNMIRHDY